MSGEIQSREEFEAWRAAAAEARRGSSDGSSPGDAAVPAAAVPIEQVYSAGASPPGIRWVSLFLTVLDQLLFLGFFAWLATPATSEFGYFVCRLVLAQDSRSVSVFVKVGYSHHLLYVPVLILSLCTRKDLTTTSTPTERPCMLFTSHMDACIMWFWPTNHKQVTLSLPVRQTTYTCGEEMHHPYSSRCFVLGSSGGGFERRPMPGKFACPPITFCFSDDQEHEFIPHLLGTFFWHGAVARRPGAVFACAQGVGRCSGGTGSGPDVRVWALPWHATLALA